MKGVNNKQWTMSEWTPKQNKDGFIYFLELENHMTFTEYAHVIDILH